MDGGVLVVAAVAIDLAEYDVCTAQTWVLRQRPLERSDGLIRLSGTVLLSTLHVEIDTNGLVRVLGWLGCTAANGCQRQKQGNVRNPQVDWGTKAALMSHRGRPVRVDHKSPFEY